MRTVSPTRLAQEMGFDTLTMILEREPRPSLFIAPAPGGPLEAAAAAGLLPAALRAYVAFADNEHIVFGACFNARWLLMAGTWSLAQPTEFGDLLDLPLAGSRSRAAFAREDGRASGTSSEARADRSDPPTTCADPMMLPTKDALEIVPKLVKALGRQAGSTRALTAWTAASVTRVLIVERPKVREDSWRGALRSVCHAARSGEPVQKTARRPPPPLCARQSQLSRALLTLCTARRTRRLS